MKHDFKCSVCNSESYQSWGGLNRHTRTDIAGIDTDVYPENKYEVLQCHDCELTIKYPFPDEDKIKLLYAQANAVQWGINQDVSNRHFDKLEALTEIPQGSSEQTRVLDYGCSNGDLLASWNDGWEKYGIELSEGAAEVAESRGINIVSEESLDEFRDYFDAIVLVDVIEHLVNPKGTFKTLLNALKPAGKLIMLTGDIDSFSFSLAKGAYWYCDIPEHLIFFNQKSLNALFNPLGAIQVHFERVPHKNTPLRRIKMLKPLFKFALFHVFKKFSKVIPSVRLGRTTYPNTAIFKDHMIAVFEKQKPAS